MIIIIVTAVETSNLEYGVLFPPGLLIIVDGRLHRFDSLLKGYHRFGETSCIFQG
jgi:hypothetical protein